MKFEIPGTTTSIRAFEPVEAVDPQYRLVDFGLEYENGGIDSLVVGVATHSLNNLCEALDSHKESKKEAEASKDSDSKEESKESKDS